MAGDVWRKIRERQTLIHGKVEQKTRYGTPWAGPLLETPIHDGKKITQKQKDQKPM
jgi:hypothetical protein